MTLNNEQIIEYIESKDPKCPYCKEGDIEGSSVEIDGRYAIQEMECLYCDKTWNDVYALITIEELKEP